MPFRSVTTFSRANRRMFSLLLASHLVWGTLLLGCWAVGALLPTTSPWLAAGFVALQLYAAAQLILPALRLHPEERSRGFYLFWSGLLALSVWLLNLLPIDTFWAPLLAVLKSSLLLLVATVIGAALARYVRRLWEVVPICLVMTFADFASWSVGPTAMFAQGIAEYYRAPVGAPPLIDMILVKLALPGQTGLAPVFGLSDWIMVVFFAQVSRHHGVNDNLLGPAGESLARQSRIGRYLPVPVLALFGAVVLAQATGRFLPVLPLLAVSMLGWYALRKLFCRGQWP